MIDPRHFRAALRAGATDLAFFDALEVEGRFIEYARAYAQLVRGTGWTSREFALTLGLLDSRRYRALLLRPEPLRAALVDVARDVLARSREALTTYGVRTSAAFARWNLELTRNSLEVKRRMGRPVERVCCVGPVAKEIEDLRLKLGWTVKRWAPLLGTSEHPYRARLERGDPEAHWSTFAREIAQREQERALSPRGVAPITEDELEQATYAVYRASGQVDATPPTPRSVEVEELDLTDVPLDEEDA